ncbi:sigma-54-dependent transcriptional regulator [Desulfopila inferna]|uniref:sigma-54-dependent transcriptional regulator n=1 Tax=Desulfopila inferna TaxID=468528 RepID=UPI001964CFD3|nr:sigma-54 dependent transcriptional regulator [Desulfopila inferna]MBM9605995.1 sigma-54-dependent Fis family transcriptional regulator [Desulfopila inferna]
MYTILMYEPQNVAPIDPALFGQSDLIFKSEAKDFQVELDRRQFDLIFLEINSQNGHNMELLEYAHRKSPYTPIIITSKSERADVVVQAMNRGASDFLVHPLTETRLAVAMRKAIESKEQKFEIDYHRRRQDVVYDFGDVIAFSNSMREVLVSLQKFAQTDSTILITGETGTGKSFLSGTVHFNSPRKKKPFVKINCANIPEALLESELFGHEKGAFTGADKQRVGRFEQACGGTIFLDEIGEMSIALQTKLLRVLEEKAFERVGGNKTINVDVRVIAATNKNLISQIEKGLFREDLYYRINVLPVRLPPLRERDLCIIPLANILLKKCCQSTRKEIMGFHSDALARIQSYGWPGNIRQLANTIERAVILTDGRQITAHNLLLPGNGAPTPQKSVTDEEKEFSGTSELQSEAGISLAGQEKELILRVLEESLWVQKNAAGRLGISPRALNYKIRKLGIRHPHWRRNK